MLKLKIIAYKTVYYDLWNFDNAMTRNCNKCRK